MSVELGWEGAAESILISQVCRLRVPSAFQNQQIEIMALEYGAAPF